MVVALMFGANKEEKKRLKGHGERIDHLTKYHQGELDFSVRDRDLRTAEKHKKRVEELLNMQTAMNDGKTPSEKEIANVKTRYEKSKKGWWA